MRVWVVSTLTLACVDSKNKELWSYSKSLLWSLPQEPPKRREFALFCFAKESLPCLHYFPLPDGQVKHAVLRYVHGCPVFIHTANAFSLPFTSSKNRQWQASLEYQRSYSNMASKSEASAEMF